MTGKEKCEFLKEIRVRMAELNGIPYEPRECHHEGDCVGTCPLCDKEAAELMAELKKKEAEGIEIKTDAFCMYHIEKMHQDVEHLSKYCAEEIVYQGAYIPNSNEDIDRKEEIEDVYIVNNASLMGDVDAEDYWK